MVSTHSARAPLGAQLKAERRSSLSFWLMAFITWDREKILTWSHPKKIGTIWNKWKNNWNRDHLPFPFSGMNNSQLHLRSVVISFPFLTSERDQWKKNWIALSRNGWSLLDGPYKHAGDDAHGPSEAFCDPFGHCQLPLKSFNAGTHKGPEVLDRHVITHMSQTQSWDLIHHPVRIFEEIQGHLQDAVRNHGQPGSWLLEVLLTWQCWQTQLELKKHQETKRYPLVN